MIPTLPYFTHQYVKTIQVVNMLNGLSVMELGTGEWVAGRIDPHSADILEVWYEGRRWSCWYNAFEELFDSVDLYCPTAYNV